MFTGIIENSWRSNKNGKKRKQIFILPEIKGETQELKKSGFKV